MPVSCAIGYHADSRRPTQAALRTGKVRSITDTLGRKHVEYFSTPQPPSTPRVWVAAHPPSANAPPTRPAANCCHGSIRRRTQSPPTCHHHTDCRPWLRIIPTSRSRSSTRPESNHRPGHMRRSRRQRRLPRMPVPFRSAGNTDVFK